MKKYFIVLADDYGISNYQTEFTPIGIIEEKNEESVRAVLAQYISTELHCDDEECEEMLSDVLPNLLKTGRYNDIEAEVAFKITDAPFFNL